MTKEYSAIINFGIFMTISLNTEELKSENWSLSNLIHPISSIVSAVGPSVIMSIAIRYIDSTDLSFHSRRSIQALMIGSQFLYDGYRLQSHCTEKKKSATSQFQHFLSVTGQIAGLGLSVIGCAFFIQAVHSFCKIDFRKPINTLWQIEGSMTDSWGDCNPQAVKAHFDKLSSKKHPIVSFQEYYLDSQHVTGGTCSAMSLSLAGKISDAKCIEQQSISCVQEIIQKYFARSGEDFRNLQAAFNSIAIDTAATSHLNKDEIVREKVSALVSYFDFTLGLPCDLSNLDKLDSGLYVGRAIKPASNHKLEDYGHTILFIKLADQAILYDPNQGGLGLSLDSTLKKVCDSIISRWSLSDFIFFPLNNEYNDRLLEEAISHALEKKKGQDFS